MNKVDLVEDKKDLLKVAKEFEDLPGYERFHNSLVFCRLTLSFYNTTCLTEILVMLGTSWYLG
jgi:hypothetical protein